MIFARGAYQELQREVRETRDIAVEARTEGRNHQQNCVEHNRRIEEMLREGRELQNDRHVENQEAISVVHGRVTDLSGKMNFLIISFLASVLLAVLSGIGAIVAHKIGLL